MVGKKIGDELSFSELLEFREVTLDLEMLALQLCDGLTLGEGFGHRLAVEFVQLRLVIKVLLMRGASGHGQENDPFDVGVMVW